jgi:hypothetical protein
MLELLTALSRIPADIQEKVVKGWVMSLAQEVARGAKALAPQGKTGNLKRGIVARSARKSRLRSIGSLARSVALGKRPAYHFHWFNRGTLRRTTKGGTPQFSLRRKRNVNYDKARSPANRGIMPSNPFMQQAAAPVIARAQSDVKGSLAQQVERVLQAAIRRTRRRSIG